MSIRAEVYAQEKKRGLGTSSPAGCGREPTEPLFLTLQSEG